MTQKKGFIINDVYTIQLASRISGVGVHTIRAWEKRYQAVTPKRNESGRRVYTESEIERLSMLSDLCSLGHSIGQIAKLPTKELKESLKRLGRYERGENLTFAGQNFNDSKQSLDNLVLALKLYKLDVISHEFNKLKLLLSPRQFVFDIVSPLLYEVGQLIKKGEINISQEQSLMALIKFHIGGLLYKQVQQKSKKEVNVLITSPEGDYHEMGILMVAMLCSHYNLNFYYLGASLPLSSVIETAKAVEADHLILSLSAGLDLSPAYINQYIDKCIQHLNDNQRLVFRSGSFPVSSFQNHEKLTVCSKLDDIDRYLSKL